MSDDAKELLNELVPLLREMLGELREIRGLLSTARPMGTMAPAPAAQEAPRKPAPANDIRNEVLKGLLDANRMRSRAHALANKKGPGQR